MRTAGAEHLAGRAPADLPDPHRKYLLAADFVVARRSFPVRLSLALAAGERFSLFGTSGAGKTTCLEAIAGWASLQQGHVRLDGRLVNVARHGPDRKGYGRPVDPGDRMVALVRQPTTLFPHLSVRANVGYGVRRQRPRGDHSVEAVLEKVGLSGLGGASSGALSGGQRQRVALARALLRPFQALLLDEPFGAVDASGRAALRRLAAEEANVVGAAAVLVTHDLAEAQAFGHRLGVMEGGELLQVGEPDQVVRHPVTREVADLCGYRSYLPHDEGRLWALHPDRFVEGDRPEAGLVLSGEVRAVEASGPRYACEMRIGEGAGGGTTVRVHTDVPPRAGETWVVTAVDPPLVRGEIAGSQGKG